jgi:hypothetical protein
MPLAQRSAVARRGREEPGRGFDPLTLALQAELQARHGFEVGIVRRGGVQDAARDLGLDVRALIFGTPSR